MRVTDLADALRAGGLTVVETDGWKTRGHDGKEHGTMAAVHGVTCHHNAGGRTTNPVAGLNTIIEGRSDLAGPLAHLYLSRAGVFYVVASGLCWHAGASLETDYDNWHRLGIEAQAAGDGWSEDWPEVQMRAYALGCRVLAEHYGFPISEVRGHKETCSPVGRKTDPDFDMTKFRAAVKVATIQEDDPMAGLTLPQIAEAVWSWDGIPHQDENNYQKPNDPKNPTWQPRSEIEQIDRNGRWTRSHVAALEKSLAAQAAQLTALTKAVTAIAAGSPDAVRQAFVDGVASLKTELAAIDVRVSLGDDTPAGS